MNRSCREPSSSPSHCPGSLTPGLFPVSECHAAPQAKQALAPEPPLRGLRPSHRTQVRSRGMVPEGRRSFVKFAVTAGGRGWAGRRSLAGLDSSRAEVLHQGMPGPVWGRPRRRWAGCCGHPPAATAEAGGHPTVHGSTLGTGPAGSGAPGVLACSGSPARPPSEAQFTGGGAGAPGECFPAPHRDLLSLSRLWPLFFPLSLSLFPPPLFF